MYRHDAIHAALEAARHVLAIMNEDDLFDKEAEDIAAAARAAAYEAEAKGRCDAEVRDAAVHAALEYLDARLETADHEVFVGLVA